MKFIGQKNPDYRSIVIYGLLLLLSFVAVLAGFYLDKGFHAENWNKLVAHVFTEIGVAGFVGFILAITFERLSAEEFKKSADEHINAIKTNVFHYVYGHDIPEEITQEIDAQILRSAFVRRDVNIEFKLEHIERDDLPARFLRSIVYMTCDMENITKDTQSFSIRAVIEKSPIDSLKDEVKIISVKVMGNNCKTPFEYHHGDKELEACLHEDAIELSFIKEIEVLPGRGTRVAIETQTVKYLNGGSDTGFLTTHVCDLDMRVHAPKDVSIFVTPISGCQFDEGGGHRPHLGTYHWKLKRPLLSHQGFLLSWVDNCLKATSKELRQPLDLTIMPERVVEPTPALLDHSLYPKSDT
jgi:hypothetical protein